MAYANRNSLQAMKQGNAVTKEKPKFSKWLRDIESKNQSVTSVVGDKAEAVKFIGNITSLVAINGDLAECDYNTILSAGLLANALKLSMSPSIGHCYLIPYKDNKNNRTVATFVLGWKGYVQLAERTGYYQQINVIPIKEGEIVKIDPINEDYQFNQILDDERDNKPTVGYFAFFQYNQAHGGFRKAIYMSKTKMLKHAARYSKAFHLEAVESNYPSKCRVSYADYLAGKYPPSDAWKYSSYWYTDFDGMAMKTMIRQLIGKWGIMSTDFQKAYDADGGYMNDVSEDGVVRHAEAQDAEQIPYMTGAQVEESTADDEVSEEEKAQILAAQAEENKSVVADFFDNGQV